MGVQLGGLLKAEEIDVDRLTGRTIAVDAFNWIYQFLSTIRQADGTPLMDSSGRVTSHLSGLLYRNLRIIEAGIKPVYVFDGPSTKMKAAEQDRRRSIKQAAKREYERAVKEGRKEDAGKYAKRTAEITSEIIEESKQLLAAMGIPFVQAKSEGEALASVMTQKGEAYAVATQDYDALLFGCTRVVRNLSVTGRKKRGNDYIIVRPEILELSKVLKELKINREQLICCGMLIGTDFNTGGIEGIGPKKAIETVKEKKTKEAIFGAVKWDFETRWEDIYDFFENPPAGNYKAEKAEFDREKIMKMLVEEHDFSEERVNNAISKMAEEKKKGQKSLQKWFK